MKLTLGFSPCPNDTFIFDALVNHKIDTEGLDFELIIEDVEALNDRAFKKELDISKLSYHTLAYCLEDYQILNSGSALGNGVGPLLIANRELTKKEIEEGSIAIPGKYTTANFLLSLAYPNATNKQVMLFSDIENAVLEEKVTAGLIIHENRFTYLEKGLVKQMDLGDYWEKESSSLIPLGGIAIKRGLSEDLKKSIDRLIKESIQYAFDNPESSEKYVQFYSQEMEKEVIQKHIDLYVNSFSLDLGNEGKAAVRKLFSVAAEKKIIDNVKEPIFV